MSQINSPRVIQGKMRKLFNPTTSSSKTAKGPTVTSRHPNGRNYINQHAVYGRFAKIELLESVLKADGCAECEFVACADRVAIVPELLSGIESISIHEGGSNGECLLSESKLNMRSTFFLRAINDQTYKIKLQPSNCGASNTSPRANLSVISGLR